MRGLLYLRDSNGEKNGEFRIEFENAPKVTINTIPTYYEGKYSGEKPISHNWENFKFKTIDVDRIPNPLRAYSFLDGTMEYFVDGVTEYKGNGNYETKIHIIDRKM
jgi:hypothetical protein